MTEEIQPIKRSKQLAILSREHHDGLLFGWKIKEGIKNTIEPKRIAAYAKWFWENDLQNHFEKEEMGLVKVLREDHPMMIRMIEDHEAIEDKIKALLQQPTYDDLARLAQIITYHIRFEERELFNQVEQLATEQELDELATMLTDDSTVRTKWDDDFWIKDFK